METIKRTSDIKNNPENYFHSSHLYLSGKLEGEETILHGANLVIVKGTEKKEILIPIVYTSASEVYKRIKKIEAQVKNNNYNNYIKL